VAFRFYYVNFSQEIFMPYKDGRVSGKIHYRDLIFSITILRFLESVGYGIFTTND